MDSFDPVAYIMNPNGQQIRLGLERITELLDHMGNPQNRCKFVHVAGTNGKGSTCSFVEAALRAAGLRTGLFTSPHLVDFSERIQVAGVPIPPDELAEVTWFVRECAEEAFAGGDEYPTEFELMTAVGFEYFARKQCDIVVCEVGLGGRLDSTNVIVDPEVCVITRLGVDHVNMLGSDPVGIAREKAAIIKPGCTVVSWPQDNPACMDVVRQAAAAVGADVRVPDMDQLVVGAVDECGMRSFSYQGRSYKTRLLGSYQPSNAVLAIEVVRAMALRGWNVTEDDIARGIEQTVWPGRFEVVESGPGKPTLLIDGGHNVQGAQVLAESLADVFANRRIVLLMSVLGDKDYRTMIDLLKPLANAWVCATPPSYRALPAADLAQAIREQGVEETVPVEAAEDFADALARARTLAGPGDVICAFGSLYSIGDLKAAL